jgi:hypothetical protein
MGLSNKTINETGNEQPEKKLWRAVFNQALEDGFGLYNTYMCDYEKHDAQLFFRTRTHQFDEICEYADIDANVAWKKIQKLKLIQKGIVNADSRREKEVMELLTQIKKQRGYREFRRKKQNHCESNQAHR